MATVSWQAGLVLVLAMAVITCHAATPRSLERGHKPRLPVTLSSTHHTFLLDGSRWWSVAITMQARRPLERTKLVVHAIPGLDVMEDSTGNSYGTLARGQTVTHRFLVRELAGQEPARLDVHALGDAGRGIMGKLLRVQLVPLAEKQQSAGKQPGPATPIKKRRTVILDP